MSQADWVKSLSVEEVASWLGSLGISQETLELFLENEVRGEDFLELSKEDLKTELCIKKIGERKRIYHEIQNILNPPSSDDEEEDIVAILKNENTTTNSPDKKVSETPDVEQDITMESPKNEFIEKKSPNNSPKKNEEIKYKSVELEVKNYARGAVTPRKPMVLSTKPLKDIHKKPKKEKFQKPYIKPLVLPKNETTKQKKHHMQLNMEPPVISKIDDQHVYIPIEKEVGIEGKQTTEESNSDDHFSPKLSSPNKMSSPKSVIKKKRIKLPNSINEEFAQLSPRNHGLSPKHSKSFSSPRRQEHIHVNLRENKEDGSVICTLIGRKRSPSAKSLSVPMPPLPSSKAPELSSTSLTDSMDLGTTNPLGTMSFSSYDFFQTDRRRTVVEEYENSLKEHKLLESKSFFDVIASPRERTESEKSTTEVKSPEIKKLQSFVKIEKDLYGMMVSNKGDSVAQFMRRGYRVLLYFVSHLSSNHCLHIFEDIAKCHKALLQVNTIPIVVHLELKDKEAEFFDSGIGKKYIKIAAISDFGMELHKAFKVDVTVLPTVLGIFKSKSSKKESITAGFLLDNFEVIGQQYIKKTPNSEKFDFLKFAMIPSEDVKTSHKPFYNLSSGFKTTMVDLSMVENTDQQPNTGRKFTIFKALQSDQHEDFQMYLKDVLTNPNRINYLRLFIAKEGNLSQFLFYEFIQNVFSKEDNDTQRNEYVEMMSNTFFNNFSIYYLGENTDAYFEGKMQKDKIDMDSFYSFVEQYMYNSLKKSYNNFMKTPLFREMAQLYPNSAKYEDYRRLKTMRNMSDPNK
eukprot:gene2727-3922_t